MASPTGPLRIDPKVDLVTLRNALDRAFLFKRDCTEMLKRYGICGDSKNSAVHDTKHVGRDILVDHQITAQELQYASKALEKMGVGFGKRAMSILFDATGRDGIVNKKDMNQLLKTLDGAVHPILSMIYNNKPFIEESVKLKYRKMHNGEFSGTIWGEAEAEILISEPAALVKFFRGGLNFTDSKNYKPINKTKARLEFERRLVPWDPSNGRGHSPSRYLLFSVTTKVNKRNKHGKVTIDWTFRRYRKDGSHYHLRGLEMRWTLEPLWNDAFGYHNYRVAWKGTFWLDESSLRVKDYSTDRIAFYLKDSEIEEQFGEILLGIIRQAGKGLRNPPGDPPPRPRR